MSLLVEEVVVVDVVVVTEVVVDDVVVEDVVVEDVVVDVVVVVAQGIEDDITVNVTQYSSDCTCSLIHNEAFDEVDEGKRCSTYLVKAIMHSCCDPI